MKQKVLKLLNLLREESPLVLNITNYVAMNNSANALLAIGASPIMSKEYEEMSDLSKICSSLVVNIGTIENESKKAAIKAIEEFNKLSKPVILDPVGAGATPYRNDILKKILNDFKVDFIRGNASEIIALAGNNITSKGVDSTESSTKAIDSALKLTNTFDCTVSISGQTDVIVSKNRTAFIHNGSPMLTKVTAMGCSCSAVLGAFSTIGDDKFYAALASQALMSLCGEIAAKDCLGPGSLQVKIIDKIFNISDKEIIDNLQIELV